ncbi:MAG: Hsp70 family protein [Syntrophobacteraceae bacterium]
MSIATPVFPADETSHRFVVGIDLGTTNSALAFVDRSEEGDGGSAPRFFNIPQLTSPGEIGKRAVLPSFLYLPGPYELAPGSTALPWDTARDYVVGELAREQGALVPGHLVSSAKSWLSHGGVDRTGAILPWGGGANIEKISPVAASARYLQHMRESWNETIALRREGLLLEEQFVVLTVPASFDEVARELTVTAAREAGLPKIVLLEEPLAAFYAWLSRHESEWQSQMRPGQIILVCDVGGGTTDFTIIAIREGEKGLRFDRLAVGEHLMLGGDNMDLALARSIEMRLYGQVGKLESQKWHQLWHQCRKAKEALMEDGGESPGGSAGSSFDVTIMGSGRKLIGDTRKATITREQAEEMILNGFFPFVSIEDAPQGVRRTGLTEFGLPFVQDPAITRHLAAFWRRFQTLLHDETGRSSLFPDYILFNGGALTPSKIRNRIMAVVQSWFLREAGSEWAPVELDNPNPELAVAVGAAYYGRVRLGEGVRVGAGSPRAYYVEAASGGENGTHGAVCLVPRGTEEGFETRLEQPSFEVLTNRPVGFHLFTSSTRLGDRLGDVVTLSEEEITPLPPIRTVLRYGKKGSAQALPVNLGVRLTEIGTLELWCRSQSSPHAWKLQFDVRQEAEPPTAGAVDETLDTATIDQAREKISGVFTRGAASGPPEGLVKDLAALLDLPKEKWSTPLVRNLSDALIECRQGRLLSPQHESRWFNLLGFCLRPGFGDPLDEWRIREVWKLYPAGLQFPRQAQGRSEWWIFWRRIAGGLSAGHQGHIVQQISSILPVDEKRKKKGPRNPFKPLSPQEDLELWMALANFERLPAETKVDLGRILLQKVLKGRPKAQELWALSRFASRHTFYGPLDQVIPSDEASHWLNALLDLDIPPSEPLGHALVQMARYTGDRVRDLPHADRDRLFEWLGTLPHPERYRNILTNPDTELLRQEEDWIFGESLPPGLILAP